MMESFVCFLTLLSVVWGHGRLIEPPSRSSAWRFGFNTPINYDDTALYCGGVGVQYGINKGKCGVCGDPWNGPKQNEAGGKYATGTIVREYAVGSTIPIAVDLTANHKGYFEFKICPNNDPRKAITQACLDRYPLRIVGHGQRFQVTSAMGSKQMQLQAVLPTGLSCSQCVVQWRYNTGNSWGVGPDGRGCIGCGKQEQFYGCADVAIGSSGSSGGTNTRTTANTRTRIVPGSTSTLAPNTRTRIVPGSTSTLAPNTRTRIVPGSTSTLAPNTRTRIVPGSTSTPAPVSSTNSPTTTTRRVTIRTTRRNTGSGCRSAGLWAGQRSMDAWCVTNCAAGYCPRSHCTCL